MKESIEKETGKESIEESIFSLGEDNYINFDFNVEVKIKNGEVIEFLGEDDLDIEINSSYYSNEEKIKKLLKPLGGAGVEVTLDMPVIKDGDEWEGKIYIDRESLNKALAEGKIKIIKNGEKAVISK